MNENDPVHDDWERFRTVTTMNNHWDRPGWAPGRSSYHWFLTFDDAALCDLAMACQRHLLDFDCLDPVTGDGLHLTVRRLAFVDEIDTADIDIITAQVAERCRTLPAFSLRVGPLAGSSGAVRFSATPWEPLLELRHMVDDVATACGLPAIDRRFRPHVGIAYCNRSVATEPIIRRVAMLRDLPPVDVPVIDLRLVRLYRDGRSYRWTPLFVAPLNVVRLTPRTDPHIIGPC
ncbi:MULTISPECIES: 2'-5' RNA ligase family protein [unclassified Frankia]|uniref:2'-5' RNA ligase family protein n=1 Tax=unclassified Frankia TaxID=2632575 RepID=UPI002AD45107|nr:MULTISPECIES: 2'-5' RNA ligase family protein [unclassified Frankia]